MYVNGQIWMQRGCRRCTGSLWTCFHLRSWSTGSHGTSQHI